MNTRLIAMEHPPCEMTTAPDLLEPLFDAITSDPRYVAIFDAYPTWTLLTEDGPLKIQHTGWSNESIMFSFDREVSARVDGDALAQQLTELINGLGIGVMLSVSLDRNPRRGCELDLDAEWYRH